MSRWKVRPVLCVQLIERKYVIQLEKPETNNRLWTVANLLFSLLFVRYGHQAARLTTGNRREYGHVENYGENAFCQFVIHDTESTCGDANCYGCGDPIFGRQRIRFIRRQFLPLKHKVWTDLALCRVV